MNFYGGAALAELGALSSHWNLNLDRLHIRIMSYLMIVFGLFLCSCPVVNHEWTGWSNALYHIGWLIFPQSVTYQSDYWSSIGSLPLIIGIICAPSVQRLLSYPALVWLGSISLPVYLLHGPLMRSVLIWMLFGWRNVEEGGDLPRPPTWLIWVCIPIFFAVVFAASHAWNLFVEPCCAWLTNKSAEWMFRKRAEHADRLTADEDNSKEGLLMSPV